MGKKEQSISLACVINAVRYAGIFIPVILIFDGKANFYKTNPPLRPSFAKSSH
jgi:hypothetical protein